MGQDREKHPHLYSRLLHKIQLLMGQCHMGLLSSDVGSGPPPPDYSQLHTTMVQGDMHLLPAIPARYLPTQTTSGGPRPPGQGAGGGGGRGGADTSTPADNPSPNTHWQTAFNNCGRQLNELRDHAPTVEDGTPVCLLWHLRGCCYERCPQSSTHTRLAGAIARQFYS